MSAFVIVAAWALGALGNTGYVDHGALYLAPNRSPIVASAETPADCAVIRLGVTFGTLSADALCQ